MENAIEKIKAGDKVELNGTKYTVVGGGNVKSGFNSGACIFQLRGSRGGRLDLVQNIKSRKFTAIKGMTSKPVNSFKVL